MYLKQLVLWLHLLHLLQALSGVERIATMVNEAVKRREAVDWEKYESGGELSTRPLTHEELNRVIHSEAEALIGTAGVGR